MLVDAERRDGKRVNRQVHAFDQRRRDILRVVAAEKRDAPLLEPRCHRRMIASLVLADGPWTELGATCPASGAQEDGVAQSLEGERVLRPRDD